MITLATGSEWFAIIDAAVMLATAVAAVTPTDKDDGVVSRAANLWRLIIRR
ncbi:hypothetical protein UFOVP730_25 [uncultured Caudovirales phage]|uniref:Uncharacterized protein n=1 Tax=uncultured Caudovirales phage TaxID=2100421 RepID=A0A6J5NMJ1_9CAUD|nr:hypothetical protein UFOVP730_25 [uncultured Caudovirales phage]